LREEYIEGGRERECVTMCERERKIERGLERVSESETHNEEGEIKG